MMTLTPEDLERMFPFRPLPDYQRPDKVYRSSSEVMLPPRRMRVSEAAERFMVLSRPDYHGPMKLDGADYMREPADMVRSRQVEAVVFAGPAQSVKTTALVEGAVAHAVTCDPIDTLVVQMTQQAARDWSLNRLGPLVRNSPSLAAKLSGIGLEVKEVLKHATPTRDFSNLVLRIKSLKRSGKK